MFAKSSKDLTSQQVPTFVEALGFEVVDVADAAAAVQWLEKSPPPEIVISDVRMPGAMNGIQLRSWIRSRYPSVHVVLMSGHLDVQVGPDVVFLQKPVTQQDLKLLLGSLPA